MNEPRDTLVGDALRRLDVPDHAPDFWDRLDADLADRAASDVTAEPGGADDAGDADVIELGAAREARRSQPRRARRAPAVAAAVAAAAALALGVGLPAVQQAADGDAQVDMADGTDDPAPDAMQPAPETTTTTGPDAVAPQRAPQDVASEWLTHLRDGEVDAAYALLDESSQSSMTLETFRELATGLAEGAGAFAQLDPAVVPLIDDEGLAATAVILTGDVQREGMVETASYPVIITGDPEDPGSRLGVGFALDGPKVDAVQPTQPSETRTSPLELDLSPTAGATWAIVDPGAPVRVDTNEGTVAIDVEALGGPGTHTVVVVSTEGGLYTARSFTVVVP